MVHLKFKICFVISVVILNKFYITVAQFVNSDFFLHDQDDTKEKSKFKIYWNIPSFQCRPFKLNFTDLAMKYKIEMNEDDDFQGSKIAILYDPGNFPFIFHNGSQTVIRNGGVPQEGDLQDHLKTFEDFVNKYIPNKEFNGIAIIDFEGWRPIFRQNFGATKIHQEFSIEVERQLLPHHEHYSLQKAASQKFEFYARQFMEDTLHLAKKIRPKASWGYYAYPYCFNYSGRNLHVDCPKEVRKENERIAWLFNLTDNFYPSMYVRKNLNANQKQELVKGRIIESQRLIRFLGKKDHPPRIIPYFWFKYHDESKTFLSEEDLHAMLTTIIESEVNGLILWGSSNDVNSRKNCEAVYKYVDEILGPMLINAINNSSQIVTMNLQIFIGCLILVSFFVYK